MQLESLFHAVAPDGLAEMHALSHVRLAQVPMHEEMAMQGVLSEHATCSEQQHFAIQIPQLVGPLVEHRGSMAPQTAPDVPPVETTPPVATPPVAIPPVATPPVPIPPVEFPPVAIPPVATPPVATPPVAIPPVEFPPVAIPPAAIPPVATPPAAIPPLATPPVTTPPMEVPPVAAPPVAIPPVATPPVTIPPVATPPVAIPPEAPPVEAIPPVAIPPVAPPVGAIPPVAIPPVAPPRSTHMLDAQVRPALHVALPKHAHFTLPVWQLEPPPQPALTTKAAPSINVRKGHLPTKTVPGVEILISDYPFSGKANGVKMPHAAATAAAFGDR